MVINKFPSSMSAKRCNFILKLFRIKRNIMPTYRKKGNSNKGRKGLYTPAHTKKAYRLALLGASLKDMAAVLEVGESTLDYWMVNNKEFMEAVRKGRTDADAKVAHALFKCAVGFERIETVVIQNKIIEYNRETKQRTERVEPLLVQYPKYYAPNPYAAIKWLGKRQRENGIWSENTKIDINHTGAVDVRHIQDALSNRTMISDADLKGLLDKSLEIAYKEQQLALTHN